MSEMVQDEFLSYLCENAEPVTVFLMCGVKLQGVMIGFDEDAILLRREGHSQLIYKHAISTIMPVAVVPEPHFEKKA